MRQTAHPCAANPHEVQRSLLRVSHHDLSFRFAYARIVAQDHNALDPSVSAITLETMKHPFPKLIDADDPRTQHVRPLFHMTPGTLLSRDEIAYMRALQDLETRLQLALSHAQQVGRAQGLADVIAQCADALTQAQAQLHQHALDARGTITTLALAAAERILLHTIRNDPHQLVPLVQHVIDSMAPAATLTLALGPDAFTLLEPLRDNLAQQRDITLQLRRCPNDTPWAMRLESPHGVVDLGLEQQLEAIAKAWGVHSDPTPSSRTLEK